MGKGIALAAVSWQQFFRKSVGHMAQLWKGEHSGHENATFYGFIMRMVDQGVAWDET